ncbi:unnamed protein product (macronuclear) [Paramecium tetraurelia]|uniref:Phospholipase n=1 Tax=Paramecium tetraurelia TaxID=5888 RepID=A0BGQ5_PARTE|nr:uncharacterized protein GSPATT00028757001 [Paramecium tetraurelia]CAK57722.1 unnamed protein product [Paramecium tetraurelia]|eukprot:XP_001425120.1 hypothetical protein (macronuclear) [Paramecium tetraurelia strain d4-2]
MNQQLLSEKLQLSGLKIESCGFIRTFDYLRNLKLQDEIRIEDIGAHNIYKFSVRILNQQYIIRRRVKDFQQLESTTNPDPLFLFKKREVIKESMEDQPKEKQQILFNFLKSFLQSENLNELTQEVLKFFEISEVEYGDFKKFKECTLKKRAGGRFSESRCTRCGTLWGRWSKRYFYISNNGVMYCKGPFGQRAQMREQLVFDYNFRMKYGKAGTGYNRGIKLEFATRHLLLVAPDYFTYTEFLTALNQAQQCCPYMQLHRFNSFAPIKDSHCKWYIDGEGYFSDVMTALLSAKEYVYITDWWMSPDLYLRRPIAIDQNDQINQDSRLDRILKKIADRGVAVYILMYLEPTIALKHDSNHTKLFLERLSQNIIVLRHPSPMPQLWSHHEKIVVVDGSVGFMGGLDLCFGRMDTQQHLLTDLDVRKQFWPGIDYANNRMKDFESVHKSGESQINRSDPRMPWHDIAVKVSGQSVSDLVRHFEQYWNHVMISQNFQKRIQHQLQGNAKNPSNYYKIQDAQLQTTHDTFFQKYKNEIREEYQCQVPEEEFKDNLEKAITKSYNPKQRLSAIFPNKQQCNKDFMEILEKIHGQKQEDEEDFEESIVPINKQFRSSIMIQPKLQIVYEKGECQTQILRSASNWSIGCSPANTEFSIQIAYTHLISEAQNFIYIENQFFISAVDDNHKTLENKVALALVQRIKKAALKKEKFKVIVFLPLLPGFAGEIDKDSAVLKVQLHWEYQTISRGGNSILETLKKDANIQDPSEYIEFYSLRTHTKILDVPKTEQIYIHSKLMIVDDEYALIGSANINDRSLVGNRDSEIAIVIYDNKKKRSMMGGEVVGRSIFAQELRTSLYMEHFGLTYEQVIDPLSPELEQLIRYNTRRNTIIYRQVFACYPDDYIKSLNDYQTFKSQGDLSKYDQLSQQIVGHAVEFPLEFLCKEDLTIKILSMEIIVPEINFT